MELPTNNLCRNPWLRVATLDLLIAIYAHKIAEDTSTQTIQDLAPTLTIAFLGVPSGISWSHSCTI